MFHFWPLTKRGFDCFPRQRQMYFYLYFSSKWFKIFLKERNEKFRERVIITEVRHVHIHTQKKTYIFFLLTTLLFNISTYWIFYRCIRGFRIFTVYANYAIKSAILLGYNKNITSGLYYHCIFLNFTKTYLFIVLLVCSFNIFKMSTMC